MTRRTRRIRKRRRRKKKRKRRRKKRKPKKRQLARPLRRKREWSKSELHLSRQIDSRLRQRSNDKKRKG